MMAHNMKTYKLPILINQEARCQRKSPFFDELDPATLEVQPFAVAAHRSDHVDTRITKVERETTDDE